MFLSGALTKRLTSFMINLLHKNQKVLDETLVQEKQVAWGSCLFPSSSSNFWESAGPIRTMLIESGDLIPVKRLAIEIPWTKRKTHILGSLHYGPVDFQVLFFYLSSNIYFPTEFESFLSFPKFHFPGFLSFRFVTHGNVDPRVRHECGGTSHHSLLTSILRSGPSTTSIRDLENWPASIRYHHPLQTGREVSLQVPHLLGSLPKVPTRPSL